MNERIKALVKRVGGPSGFSRAFGAPNSTAKKYSAGIISPPGWVIDNLEKIERDKKCLTNQK